MIDSIAEYDDGMKVLTNELLIARSSPCYCGDVDVTTSTCKAKNDTRTTLAPVFQVTPCLQRYPSPRWVLTSTQFVTGLQSFAICSGFLMPTVLPSCRRLMVNAAIKAAPTPEPSSAGKISTGSLPRPRRLPSRPVSQSRISFRACAPRAWKLISTFDQQGCDAGACFTLK